MTWPIQRQVEYMSLNQCVEGKSILIFMLIGGMA